MVERTSQKSTEVWHTTGFTSLRFSSVFTILVLPLLITYLTFLTSDIYDVNYDVRYLCAYIKLKRYYSMNTAKNTGTLCSPLVWKSSANGQFPQIPGWFTRKSVETVISTSGNQKKFHHFAQWQRRLLLYDCVFYSEQVEIFQKNVSHISLSRFIILKFPLPRVFIWP